MTDGLCFTWCGKGETARRVLPAIETGIVKRPLDVSDLVTRLIEAESMKPRSGGVLDRVADVTSSHQDTDSQGNGCR